MKNGKYKINGDTKAAMDNRKYLTNSLDFMFALINFDKFCLDLNILDRLLFLDISKIIVLHLLKIFTDNSLIDLKFLYKNKIA
ncbi:MAG: hypothetical protein ACK4IX_12610 [Candidatus Sericytochromatia bacterium]